MSKLLSICLALLVVCGCSEEHPQTSPSEGEKTVAVKAGQQVVQVRKEVRILDQLLSDSARRQAKGNERRLRALEAAISNAYQKVERLGDLTAAEKAVVEKGRGR